MSTADVRARRVDVTRRAIIDAARRLFAKRGYAQTGIRDVAVDAGVAVQTIYSAFGSKAGLLNAMLDLIAEQAEVEELAAQGVAAEDPHEMISVVGLMHRQLYERCGDLIDMFEQGAATDDELRRVAEAGPSRRRAAVEAMVGLLRDRGALAPGIDTTSAEVSLTVLLSAEGHRETVREREMTYDEYQTWVTDAMERILLG